MKYIFCWLIVVAGMMSCQKDAAPPVDNTIDLPERNIIDTAYGTDPLQKIDIYLPAKRNTTTKTIVLIHGGGWTAGTKTDLSSSIPALQDLLPEYAVVNINYRLAKNGNTHLFPAQENDIKAALQFFQDNTGNFNISGDMIMIGFSAGAHLALLHSYKNDPQRHVKAVVDFFGPTDLVAFWSMGLGYQLILYNVTAKTYDQEPGIYTNSSPINFITAQTPPTIILQGGADMVVPVTQANILATALEKQHILHELVIYPNEGHGWTGNNLLDSYQKVKAFVEKHVQ